jgi:excisionase family DNA binding protein
VPYDARVLMTTIEVAALLRVHPKHVYRLLKRGLPAHRVGDEWRFDEQAVLRWARLAERPAALAAPLPAEARAGGPAPLVAGNGDLALEALLDGLRAPGAPLLGLVQADHATGLELLGRGAVLLAGCHGDAPPACAGRGKLGWIHLATRELGIGFRRGLRVRRVSAVVGRRFASRPVTAGIRQVLDAALREAGVDAEAAHAGATLHGSHRDAAMAVVRGEAEVALVSRAWAVRAGLGFLAVGAEGYGLALGAEDLGDPRVVALCEVAQGAGYRRVLGRELGYDARKTGEVRFGAAP